MIKELEQEIRDLQKELAEIKKDQSVLRLQPCWGDSEIRKKDAKFDELDKLAKTIKKNIRDLTSGKVPVTFEDVSNCFLST